MHQFFLVLCLGFLNICHACFEEIPMSPEAHFGGLKPFTDLYATQGKVFLYKPAYSKRTFGTKAEEHTPLHLYLTPITSDESEAFMGDRLETLQKALTNSHLKTRQVGSVEIDYTISGGQPGVLKSMREIYNLIRVLRGDPSFPYQEPGEMFFLKQYPGKITFHFKSKIDPDFMERFYKPNSHFFSSSDIFIPGSTVDSRNYTVDFYVSPSTVPPSRLKFGSVFTQPFENYIDLPPAYEPVASAPPFLGEKESGKIKRDVPVGGVPVHPGREGFTRPVDFVPDRQQPAVDSYSQSATVLELAQKMEKEKFN